ncbi:MAG: hypothetical protein KIB43_10745 [Clostridium baratii]|uniref:hypothetical protein n=2 Tax=Clostridium baratii TaxID=1561 RepID=UPI00292FBB4B|nr:hypothetical protein [Clostridium baratii]MBS6007427.1 hypothetical protein [Clostridium baratii]
MGKYYKKMFWGYLLIFLHFNINMGYKSVDILPDFIGYIMIGLALTKLATKEKIFKKGVNASYILAAVGIFNIGISVEMRARYSFAINIFSAIVGLFVTYSICKGIENEGIKYNKEDLSNKAKSLWKLEFTKTMLYISLTSIMLNFNQGTIIQMANGLLIAFAIFTLGMLLILLNLAGGELNEVN